MNEQSDYLLMVVRESVEAMKQEIQKRVDAGEDATEDDAIQLLAHLLEARLSRDGVVS